MVIYRKKSFIITFIIVISVVVVVLFLPTIFSSTIGKSIIEKKIEQKFNGKVTIKKLSLSWFGPQRIESFNLVSSMVDLSFNKFSAKVPLLSLVNLQNLTKQTILSLRCDANIDNANLSLNFPGYPPAKFYDISLSLTTQSQPNVSILEIQGQTNENNHKGYFSSNLSLSPSKNHINFNGNIYCKDLPTSSIDPFISLITNKNTTVVSSTFGSFINLNTTFAIADNTGPFRITLNSPRTNLDCHANLSEKTITLNRPLTTNFYLSQELCKILCPTIDQNLTKGLRSKQPIRIYIDNHHFSYPLTKPFEIQNLSINNATVDLGIIEVNNKDAFTSLFRTMKVSPIASSDRLVIWFTPFHLQILDGLLNAGRMDMLLNDTIHLCTWGTIKLIRQSLDMTLGIPADTLYQMLGITNLPNDYVLQIPIKGKFSNIKVDTTLATTKIAALMASSHANKGAAGIIGDIVGGITTMSEKPAPPPNRPFPWEGKTQHNKQRKGTAPKEVKPEDFFRQFFGNLN
jgi:hypothetical protein